MGRVQRARGRRGREGTGTGSEGRPAYAMKRRGQESEGGMTTTMAAIARRWRRRMQWACRTRRRNQGRERRRQPGGQGGGGWSDHRTGSGLAELAKCGRARRLLQGESDGGVSVPSHEMARSGSGAKRAGGLEEEVDVLRECEGRREERRRRREGRGWQAVVTSGTDGRGGHRIPRRRREKRQKAGSDLRLRFWCTLDSPGTLRVDDRSSWNPAFQSEDTPAGMESKRPFTRGQRR
ncbi:hypothetical protein EDB85DRAFT_1893526 [Lactarius pseudohatsudake]|nr:hypothetical protein EDB85DRAFT_1893526 [Lactarius pseudohatsudake]